MKLIKGITIGTNPISKIYFNNEVIYEQSNVKIMVLAQSNSILDSILKASPQKISDTVPVHLSTITAPDSYAILSSIVTFNNGQGTIGDTSCSADANTMNFMPIQLCANENILSMATPITTAYVELSSYGFIQLYNISIPTVQFLIETYGKQSQLSINTIGAPHNIPTVYGYTTEAITCTSNGYGKSSPIVISSGHTNKMYMKNKASAHGVKQIEASMLATINTISELQSMPIPQKFSNGHDNIYCASNLTVEAVPKNHLIASHTNIQMTELSDISKNYTASLTGHDIINPIETVSNAILWQYPKDTGDYWLLVQAQNAQKIDEQTLEVI